MKKILFIEDEATLQKTIGETLRKEGYKVLSALDGETGLRLAQQELPDLILLDLILPKMHGLDLLAKLREDEKTKDIPVIVLTNIENPQGIEKAVSLGARAYLVKSDYKLDEVIKKIKETIQ